MIADITRALDNVRQLVSYCAEGKFNEHRLLWIEIDLESRVTILQFKSNHILI